MAIAFGLRLCVALGVVFATAGFADANSRKIAFVGDSMADGIWGAFFRLTGSVKCNNLVGLIRDARNGSGLARPYSYDWETDIDKLVSKEQPDVIVASIGLNDRQALVTRDRHQIRLGTAEWLDAYRQNVASFYKHATAGGARVLIVGLPTLRDGKADAHAKSVNQIFASEAKSQLALKVTYVQPWQPDGGDGSFASFGPDLGGATVAIRAPDGIHFTQAGYDVLAQYLRPLVAESLADQGDTVGDSCFGP
jgi:hypothetical protein